jgi:hypothetical protein
MLRDDERDLVERSFEISAGVLDSVGLPRGVSRALTPGPGAGALLKGR